jgi:alginate O-acetyltransferase complex protein AlgJ
LPPLHEAWLPREHALHRPRHGGRQLTALICAAVFFVPPVLSLMFGARPAEIENRRLADFPSLSSGWGFFTGMSQWATDHLVFRSGAVHAADGVSQGLFGEPAPFNQGGSDLSGPLGGNRPTGPKEFDLEENQGTPKQVPPGAYRKVIEGEDGWLYYGQDFDYKCQPAKSLDQSIAQVRKLREVVEASGRKFVFVVAPDKSTMVPENLPASFPQKDCWEQASKTFWTRVPAETGAIDLRPSLEETKKSVQHVVYHKLDTHWTDEGALALTRLVAENTKPGITGTWRTRIGDEWADNADLPPLLARTGKKKGEYYSLLPNGRNDRTQEMNYEYNTRVVHFGSGAVTGTISDKTMLLGDSFGITCGRYLAAAFNDLSMTHYQTLGKKRDEVISALADQKTIVLEVVERVLSDGTPPILDPAIIDRLGQELQKHPVR